MGSSWLFFALQAALNCNWLANAGAHGGAFDQAKALEVMGEKAMGMDMTHVEGHVEVEFEGQAEYTFEGEEIDDVAKATSGGRANVTCNMTWTCPATTAFTATWAQQIDSVFKVGSKPSIKYTGATNGTNYAVSMHEYGNAMAP